VVVSGNGCYAPLPGAPIAWDGLGSAPTETASTGSGPKKNARAKKEVLIEPIRDVAPEPNPKSQGKKASPEQEAADQAAEEKLIKQLTILPQLPAGARPTMTRPAARRAEHGPGARSRPKTREAPSQPS
jgi:hypothetical protein